MEYLIPENIPHQIISIFMRLYQDLKLIGKGSFEVFTIVTSSKTTSRAEHTFMHNLNKKPSYWVLSNGGFQQEQRQEFQIFVKYSLFHPNKKCFPTPKCLFKVTVLNKPDLVVYGKLKSKGSSFYTVHWPLSSL